MSIRIEATGDGCRIPVRVQPRAARSELAGEHDGRLKVRLAAPPVDGAANDELLRLLARALGVPRQSVRLHSGERGRSKVVAIDGLAPAEAARRLAV